MRGIIRSKAIISIWMVLFVLMGIFLFSKEVYAIENEISIEVGDSTTIEIEYRGGSVYCEYTDSDIANVAVAGTSVVNNGTIKYYKTINITGQKAGSTVITFYDSYGVLTSCTVTVSSKTISYEGHVNSTQTINYTSIVEDNFYSEDSCCTVLPVLVSKSTSTVSINGNSTTTVKYNYSIYISYTEPYNGTINLFSESKGLLYSINVNIYEHIWNDEYSVITDPTCTSKGTEAILCSFCGEIKEDSIRELQTVPHTWSEEYTVIKPATCNEEGIKEFKCLYCEEKKQESIDLSDEHEWDEGIITKEPTENDTGIRTYKCNRCGAVRTESLDKLPETPKVGVVYSTHVQSFGWQDTVKNGELAGTVGLSKRLEAITIELENAPYRGNIEYKTHVQSYGWMNWVQNGYMSGTSGEAKRLEAIRIRITGEMAEHYDIYYRVQAQTYGWLGWAKNGEYAGTAGLAKRLEAIQIILVEKGTVVDGNTLVDGKKLDELGGITSKIKQTPDSAYIAKMPKILYQTHIQSIGWQDWKSNGQMSGTSGEAKRLEGIKILLGSNPYAGEVRYTTHVQTYGWQGAKNDLTFWSRDGQMSGTSGEAKRLEAIKIMLYGDMADHYDIYYRVHAQTYGWLGWVKNGEASGTAGYAKRLEGIQIVLVEKGKAGPGKTYGGITSNTDKGYIEK